MPNGRERAAPKGLEQDSKGEGGERGGDKVKLSCFPTHCDLLSVAGFCVFCLPFAGEEMAVSCDSDSLNPD